MSRESLQLGPQLIDYLRREGVREDPLLARLRDETGRLPQARMQVSPEQGQLMRLLVRLLGARRAVEVGTFTGYSALCVARALPPDGRLVACDVSEEWTAIARRYWDEAGVAHKIDLRLAPALETLAELEPGSFDFAFIDADKESYLAYYERCLELLRPGGLLAVDNVLWSGAVADPDRQDSDTVAIRALNRRLHQDERIELSMIPIGDGLTLALKREGA